jgi:membrane protein
VRLRSALVGGLVAALLWQTVGWGFAVFVTSSTRYYVIYSSFAILLLFLLWLHVGWVIVLLGAQVAYSHQYVLFYQREHDLLAQSAAGREKLALQLLVFIGQNFYRGLDPMNVLELSNRMRLPAGIVKELLQLFTQTKLLIPLTDEESFVLGRDPQTISIKEILDCVRNGGRKTNLLSEELQDESEVNELLLKLDQSVSKALEGQTLQTLIATSGASSSRKASTSAETAA